MRDSKGNYPFDYVCNALVIIGIIIGIILPFLGK